VKFTRTGSVSLVVKSRWMDPSPCDTAHAVESHSHSPNTVNGFGMESPSVQAAAASAAVSSRRLELHFAVTDTGIGISAKQLEGLFVTFGQVHHSSGEYGGSGLGLVISNRLVQAMGGSRITVKSAVGVGSTFDFKLVLRPSLNSLPDNHDMYNLTQIQRNQIAQTRILFISDRGVAAKSWAHLMTSYNAKLDQCVDIDTAVAYLSERARVIHQRNLAEEISYQELCSLISVIVIDLDTIDAAEEQVLQSLALFSPLRLLFLRTKYHHMTASASPNSTHVQRLPLMGEQVSSAGSTAWSTPSVAPPLLSLPTPPSSSVHFVHTAAGSPEVNGLHVIPAASVSPSRAHGRRVYVASPAVISPAVSSFVTIPSSSPSVGSSFVVLPDVITPVHRSSSATFHRSDSTNCSGISEETEPTEQEKLWRRHHALSIKRILHKPFHCSVFLSLLADLSTESFRSIADFEAESFQQSLSTPRSGVPTWPAVPAEAFQQLPPQHTIRQSTGGGDGSNGSPITTGGGLAWPSSNLVSAMNDEMILLPLASAHAAAVASSSRQSSAGVGSTIKVAAAGKNVIQRISQRCPLRVMLAEDNIVNQVSGRSYCAKSCFISLAGVLTCCFCSVALSS
jgi:hypothetical protein